MLHGRMLRYLDEVARAGSIRKAADRLNVAASAINRQILSLEQELETPIFERMPGGLRLTATGEILIVHVRETLREHQKTLGRMAALKGLMRGEVVIATMGGLVDVLSDVLSEFRRQHPRVKLVVRVLLGEQIVRAVLDGEADLGLAYDLPQHPRLFRAMEWRQSLGAVFAPDHPLADRLSVRFADLMPYPLVTAERGMALREAVEQQVPSNIEFLPAVETNAIELMKLLARETPSITFMGLVEVQKEVRAGRLAFVPFSGTSARQSLALVHRAAGSLDAVASVVVQHISAQVSARAET
ncbi:LysR family transcriptional regulator [Chelatococcus sambhunathii]|uniref:LysR family transcriptional regulator n=1 Tax=Chelatococcus sambhunathii TaxID=363953 RepID=A0ABU1DDJ2_9HYPH|nr:LysR family transcriptional regulator [Chelatococcus sambhunathii]MDR4306005.1 LysR family transcriptional regulator [Chelatococcus sambhunathii]